MKELFIGVILRKFAEVKKTDYLSDIIFRVKTSFAGKSFVNLWKIRWTPSKVSIFVGTFLRRLKLR